jgi:hypothetical protein
MVTDQFNHGPAQLLVHTGHQNLGHPSIGSWVTWGLGSENQNLPGFIVLTSGGQTATPASVWGSGYLPSVYQGVQCRSAGDPVLNLRNPAGIDPRLRRRALDALAAQPPHRRRSSATRNRSPASPNTKWPSACSSCRDPR